MALDFDTTWEGPCVPPPMATKLAKKQLENSVMLITPSPLILPACHVDPAPVKPLIKFWKSVTSTVQMKLIIDSTKTPTFKSLYAISRLISESP